ncbi:hypothetical protein APUTEX25_003488, partial [Auxenochlorella protothecoides]
ELAAHDARLHGGRRLGVAAARARLLPRRAAGHGRGRGAAAPPGPGRRAGHGDGGLALLHVHALDQAHGAEDGGDVVQAALHRDLGLAARRAAAAAGRR